MKRMLTAAVAAMALVGGMVQEASASCKFTFGLGMNLCFETGGWYAKSGGWEKIKYPAPGPGGYGDFGGFAPDAAPEMAPAPAVAPKSWAPPRTSAPIQSVGYYTYPGYSVPTVWWGN